MKFSINSNFCKKLFKQSSYLISCLTLLVASFCASCQKKTRQIPSHSQIVHLNLRSEPPTLDPRRGGDVISSHMHFLLFEGLVRLNPDGSIQPAQAQTFEISEEGKVYTFHLRESYWSNGAPVTAHDFEKSWKDILDPNFPSVNAHLLYPIKNAEKAKKGMASLEEVGICAKDAKTLVVTLEKPTPYFLDLVAFCVFFPVNITNDRSHPNWALEAGETFVCNGPFKLQGWKHHNELVAIRNPDYWDQTKVRPDLIHFSMVSNEMTALQMFENKELDMIGEPISPLPVDALAALKKKGIVRKHPVGGTTMIAFNTQKPPFTNANIRKGLSLAINRGLIVQNITQMGETPATGAVPPVLKNNRNHPFFKDCDLALAKELFEKGLTELGMAKEDFSKITYYYASSDLNSKVAQAIQQQWKENLGIQIQIENLDHKILMDKLTKRDFLCGQSMWVAQYNDQMNILERFKFKSNPKNYAGWENNSYIALLDESCYENGMRRAEILEKAESIFLDEMPICPIYHWDMAYLIQPYLSDVALTSIGDIVFEKLTVDEAKKMR